jgi:uncharacterized membrane protein YhaH (DUF805 family)
MDPIDLLFGFKGRIGRANCWLAVVIWFVVWIVAVVLLLMLGLPTAMIVVAVIVGIPAVVSWVAVGIKRLHDRDKSGWWLLVFYAATFLVLILANRASEGFLHSVLSIIGLALLIWAIVELGCLRGSIGINQYGPDPVAPRPAKH